MRPWSEHEFIMLFHVDERVAEMMLLKVYDEDHQPCELLHKARIL